MSMVVKVGQRLKCNVGREDGQRLKCNVGREDGQRLKHFMMVVEVVKLFTLICGRKIYYTNDSVKFVTIVMRVKFTHKCPKWRTCVSTWEVSTRENPWKPRKHQNTKNGTHLSLICKSGRKSWHKLYKNDHIYSLICVWGLKTWQKLPKTDRACGR